MADIDGGTNKRFLVGDPVEVAYTDEGLLGAWFTGVVVEVHNGQRLVEIDELLEEDNIHKVREMIPVRRASDGEKLAAILPVKVPLQKSKLRLRPCPPVDMSSESLAWTQGTCVDCFANDAWWEGILYENVSTTSCQAGVCISTHKSEVNVYFPDEDVDMISKVNLMRIGQDWDEKTGFWSKRGCAPVPVAPATSVGRPSKRSRKDSDARENNNGMNQHVMMAADTRSTRPGSLSTPPAPRSTPPGPLSSPPASRSTPVGRPKKRSRKDWASENQQQVSGGPRRKKGKLVSTDAPMDPSMDPSMGRSIGPSMDPSMDPSIGPSMDPSIGPSIGPAIGPAFDPTIDPAIGPSIDPSIGPIIDPSNGPSVLESDSINLEDVLMAEKVAILTVVTGSNDTLHVGDSSGVPNEGYSTGYAYQERLNMVWQSGLVWNGAPSLGNGEGNHEPTDASPNWRIPEKNNLEPTVASPPNWRIPVANRETADATPPNGRVPEGVSAREGRSTLDDVLATETEAGVGQKNAEDYEAARKLLDHSGWTIKESVNRKTGKVTWKCKSPKINGAASKPFDSLVAALKFESLRGPPCGVNGGGAIRSHGSNLGFGESKDGDGIRSSQIGFTSGKSEDAVEDESEASRDARSGDDVEDVYENEEYASPARQILRNFGWEVFKSLRKGSDSQSAWVYKTPKCGTQKCNRLRNWHRAVNEYTKQKADDPKQKKGRGRGQKLSPVIPTRRLSRRQIDLGDGNHDLIPPPSPFERKKRVINPKKQVSFYDDVAENTAAASGPDPSSAVKSEKVPLSVLPNVFPGDDGRGFLNLDDDDDLREVNIGINCGSLRADAGVDLGQGEFMRPSTTAVGSNTYQEKPFGAIVNFTEKDNAYDLQVVTHGFLKEQVKVVVERGDMVIRARYGVDEKVDQLSMRCTGCVSGRVTLPKNVEYKLISAELKSPLLTLTLPKIQPMQEEIFDVKIE